MIAGVCGGLAEWLGWDATLVRVLYIVLSVLSGRVPGDPGLRDPLGAHAGKPGLELRFSR